MISYNTEILFPRGAQAKRWVRNVTVRETTEHTSRHHFPAISGGDFATKRALGFESAAVGQLIRESSTLDLRRQTRSLSGINRDGIGYVSCARVGGTHNPSACPSFHLSSSSTPAHPHHFTSIFFRGTGLRSNPRRTLLGLSSPVRTSLRLPAGKPSALSAHAEELPSTMTPCGRYQVARDRGDEDVRLIKVPLLGSRVARMHLLF